MNKYFNKFIPLIIMLFGACSTLNSYETQVNPILEEVVKSFKTENIDQIRNYFINRADLEFITSLPDPRLTEEYKAWTKTRIDSVLVLGTKLFEESFRKVIEQGKTKGINWSKVEVDNIDKRRYNKEGNELLISNNTISFTSNTNNIKVEFECAKMKTCWKIGSKFKIISD